MIDQGLATVIAAGVALLIGIAGVLVSIVQSARTSRATVVANLNALEVDALTRVLRYASKQGVSIQDEIFNLTLAEWGSEQDYEWGPKRREVSNIPRSDYAEASALVAAYGVGSVQEAFQRWSNAVDAWADKRANLDWDFFEGDQSRPSRAVVEAEMDGEISARRALGEAVNLAVRRLRSDA